MSAIVKADDYVGGLPEVFQLAKSLKLAGGFLPPHLKNEGEIVAVVLAGRELGLPPMASIRGIKLVKGNVTLDASLQLALMVRAGCKVKWLKDGSDGEAVLRLERPGQEPHESKFTLADARKAGLSGDNWSKYPAAMLRARAVTTAGKAYVPDVLSGVYLPDELPDAEEKPVAVVRGLDDAPRATPQERLDAIAAGGQRAESRPYGRLADATADAGSAAPTTDATATTTASTTDGELLDARAWRDRYFAECDDAAARHNVTFTDQDEYDLPVPPFDEPKLHPKSKQHANLPYSQVPGGYLREVVVGNKVFAQAELAKRLHALYWVCRWEIEREQREAKEQSK